MSKPVWDEFNRIKADEKLKDSVRHSVMNRAEGRGKKVSPPRMRWAVSVACSILFLVTGMGGYGVYNTEAAAISVDINPSIELSINRWGRIVDVRTFDKDTRIMMDDVTLNNLTYEEGLERLLSSELAGKYLKEGCVVSVTLLTDGANEDVWLNRVESCVDQVLQQNHDGVSAQYGCTTSEARQEAHHQGMSMGKYCAIQDVLKEDSEVTMDELRDLNMSEIKSHKNSCGHVGNTESPQDSTSENHH